MVHPNHDFQQERSSQQEHFSQCEVQPTTASFRGGIFYQLTGCVTGGLIALAVVVCGTKIFSGRFGVVGPDAESVIVHLFGAVLGIGAVLLVKKINARGASLVIFLVTIAMMFCLLLSQWWGS